MYFFVVVVVVVKTNNFGRYSVFAFWQIEPQTFLNLSLLIFLILKYMLKLKFRFQHIGLSN